MTRIAKTTTEITAGEVFDHSIIPGYGKIALYKIEDYPIERIGETVTAPRILLESGKNEIALSIVPVSIAADTWVTVEDINGKWFIKWSDCN